MSDQPPCCGLFAVTGTKHALCDASEPTPPKIVQPVRLERLPSCLKKNKKDGFSCTQEFNHPPPCTKLVYQQPIVVIFDA